jgi:hypothetical protein
MSIPQNNREEADPTPEQLYGVIEIGGGVEECLVDLAAAAAREAAGAPWPEEPPLTPEQLYGVIDIGSGVEECLVEGCSSGPAIPPGTPTTNGPAKPTEPTDRNAP